MVSTLQKKVSINDSIEFGKCEALNVEGTEPVKGVFGFGSVLKSTKGDPEMMINVNFKEKISITGILIECSDENNTPQEIQLFSGKQNVDFSDVGTVAPTEKLKVKAGSIMNLKLAKYRNIDSLVLYFSNESGDIVQLNNIQFYGTQNEGTDLSQIKNTNP